MPTAWRRLQVRSVTTLTELHEVLQIAMGWEGYQLHAFQVGGQCYGSNGRSETRATLAEVVPAEGGRVVYVYDFGDEWEHVIEVERILAGDRPSTAYPRCTAGRRACPPEDSGGPWGYADLLRALRRRRGLRYQEIRETLPCRFDPEAFDLKAVNHELARMPAGAAR